MLNINYKKNNDNGIDYIGTTKLNEKDLGKILQNICNDQEISIFWQLKKDGEFFISIDLTPTKICTGGLI